MKDGERGRPRGSDTEVGARPPLLAGDCVKWNVTHVNIKRNASGENDGGGGKSNARTCVRVCVCTPVSVCFDGMTIAVLHVVGHARG